MLRINRPLPSAAWLHFIPMQVSPSGRDGLTAACTDPLHCLVQVDYSDMWDIMAFFRGGLNGEHSHDDLGKEIAIAGKEWVKQCYRWADLEAYQFRYVLSRRTPWHRAISGNQERTPPCEADAVMAFPPFAAQATARVRTPVHR